MRCTLSLITQQLRSLSLSQGGASKVRPSTRRSNLAVEGGKQDWVENSHTQEQILVLRPEERAVLNTGAALSL